MAVLKKEELIEKVKTVVPDITSDEAVSFLEDLTDTLDAGSTDEYEKIVEDLEALKTKYENLDKEWREKYVERFFTTEEREEEKTDEREEEREETEIKFEDIIKEEEK